MKLFLAIFWIIPALVRAQGPPYGTPITSATSTIKVACVVLVKSTKECTGVMVGPRHVVTAAQCVTNGAKVASSATVTACEINGQIISSSKTVQVDKIIVNEKYIGGSKDASTLVQNDMALLKLNQAVDPLLRDGTYKKCSIAPTKATEGMSMQIVGYQKTTENLGLVQYATKVRSSDKCVAITDPAKAKGYTDTICTTETKNTYCDDTVIGGGLFDKKYERVYGLNHGTTLTGCNTGVTYFHLSLTGFSKAIQNLIAKYP